jgi:hypothetical protein
MARSTVVLLHWRVFCTSVSIASTPKSRGRSDHLLRRTSATFFTFLVWRTSSKSVSVVVALCGDCWSGPALSGVSAKATGAESFWGAGVVAPASPGLAACDGCGVGVLASCANCSTTAVRARTLWYSMTRRRRWLLRRTKQFEPAVENQVAGYRTRDVDLIVRPTLDAAKRKLFLDPCLAKLGRADPQRRQFEP